MIQLNGICKEKFLEWFSEPETYFYRLNNTCQNALIIEFFDSKNIFIEVSGIFYQGFEPEFNYNIQEKGTLNGINGEVFNSRQEATIQAIKKANEIYNERFK